MTIRHAQGDRIEIVPEIGSTNAVLLARLGAGETFSEDYWLVADRQSAGRGRAGRVWNDGHGNFMGSTVVRLRAADPLPQTLALVAGLAVYKAVAAALASQSDTRTLTPDPLALRLSKDAGAGLGPSTGSGRAVLEDGKFADPIADLRLKWPNDLLLDGAKLAGILLERQGDAVVVGIGVNLAHAPDLPDRRTTSLAAAGSSISRDAFADALAAEWTDALTRWHLGEWPVLREGWLLRAHPVGTLVSVKDRAQGELIGAFAGIDENGVAFLRLADGQRHAIHAGDIEMVG